MEHPKVRETVDFTEFGEPYGPGSVELSSYLGPLVREHVPILIDDWRMISENIKTVLWRSIQARFELDEEFQKTVVFRQMGCIWRSSKSRVVTQIRKARTMKDRMQLKPKNIPPMEWRKFVNQKTSLAFKAVSDSYKERWQKQIQMHENQAQLQQKVQELEAIVQKMNNQREDEQGETSTPRVSH